MRMSGQPTGEVEIYIEAPTARIWELLTDLDALERAIDIVEDLNCESSCIPAQWAPRRHV